METGCSLIKSLSDRTSILTKLELCYNSMTVSLFKLGGGTGGGGGGTWY